MKQIEGQITIDMWMQWREDIRTKLNETANNFVYIGYRLKQIRDSGMFGECDNLISFAQKEYGLGKSAVSRFIAINDKFSEDGNSELLKEEYRGLTSSKLSEMLTLTEADCTLITEQTTIKEIRELKNHIIEKEGEEIEESKETTEYTAVEKCIIDFFQNKDKKLNEVMKLLKEPDEDKIKMAAELINPTGQCSHKKGVAMMFFYGYEQGIKCKLLTEVEPRSMTYAEFMMTTRKIFQMAADETEKVWELYYPQEQEEEEEKQEEQKAPSVLQNQGLETVATSQQEEKIEIKMESEENTPPVLQNQGLEDVATSQQQEEIEEIEVEERKIEVKEEEIPINAEQSVIVTREESYGDILQDAMILSIDIMKILDEAVTTWAQHQTRIGLGKLIECTENAKDTVKMCEKLREEL